MNDLKIIIPENKEESNQRMINELEDLKYKYLETISFSLYGLVALVLPPHSKEESPIVVKMSYKQRISSNVANDDPFTECEYMKKLKHDHIVEYLDSIETEIALYIFTPYYEHGDLFSFLEKKYIFSREEIYVIIQQILLALLYLDSQNFIYSDVSAENVIVTSIGSSSSPSGWKIKLIDLGSMYVKSDFNRSDHILKPLPGKVSYRPPDYLAYIIHCIPFDPLSSYIYTLGIITYMLFTGLPPYNKPNDLWFNVIITGQWIEPKFINKIRERKKGDVYIKIPEKDLHFIDSCIKYHKDRLSLTDFKNFLNLNNTTEPSP